MRHPFLLLLIILCASVNAQNTIPKNKITLGTYRLLNSLDAEETIPVFIQGDIRLIENKIIEEGEQIKYTAGDIVAADISKQTIQILNQENFVEKIDCPTDKVTLLNDRMVIMNNVDSAYLGFAPLLQGYDGTGIVIGVMDAPFDIHHGDFDDADGNSRIKSIWGQDFIAGPHPDGFTYGKECDSADIADDNCPVNDNDIAWNSHGSGVAGVATSSGLAANQYRGVAPNADIVLVAFDFFGEFTSRVADAIEYIFNKADEMGKPCVINTSLGVYAGSHDGTDLLTQTIDNLIQEHSGRSLVAAAGNAGGIQLHLGYDVSATEQFTWFKKLSYTDEAYFQLWADSIEFNDVYFSLTADNPAGFINVGSTPDYNMIDDLDLTDGEIDSIEFDIPGGGSGKIYAQLMDGVYLLEFVIFPDDDTFYWRFTTSGSGYFDIWSGESTTGFSNYVTLGLPDAAILPEIVNYKLPDTQQSIVSGWQCSESVITVGTYVNRDTMTNYYGVYPTLIDTVGQLYISSSLGPTRDGRIKPDICASGTRILSTASEVFTDYLISVGLATYISQDGQHSLFNGTSFSSPIVAGIAALYLQQFPTAWYDDVKSAILTTAVEDTFTGAALPDNKWGYGKLNGFRALIVPFVGLDGEIKNDNLLIYPNPAGDIIYISGSGNATVDIYNLVNELVVSTEINEADNSIDIHSLKTGMYLMVINDGKNIAARKVIKCE
ncbi:MAG: S8/S53 family peptidase [Chitinophagales bacterium]